MRTRLGLIWATTMSVYDAVAYQLWPLRAALVDLSRGVYEWLRPLDKTGPQTSAEADAFVADMRDVAGDAPELVKPALVESSPIFDVLTQEWPALWARRERALRWPTAEIDVRFRDLTSVLELDWLCDHCEQGDHADCPSCSCSCSMVAAR